MTQNNGPYPSGHFELRIDGQKSTAFLKSIEGGYASRPVIVERYGHVNFPMNHLGSAEIEQFSLELGLAGADDILKWIQSSWRMQAELFNGQVTHANFDMQETEIHQFKRAWIVETTFPTLDGASKDPAYLKVKFATEEISSERIKGGGPVISAPMTSLQKLWSACNFELEIDGVPEFRHTNKIDSFTIKQGVKKFSSPNKQKNPYPAIVPTKIEFPNLSGTVAAGYCDAIHKWSKETLERGAADPSVQKHGALHFLGPRNNERLFSIELGWVGLYSFKMLPSAANADQIKRFKFDLHVGKMDIDGKHLGLA